MPILKSLGLVASAVLGLAAFTTRADAHITFGIGLGYAPPVYAEPYYDAPPPVYYQPVPQAYYPQAYYGSGYYAPSPYYGRHHEEEEEEEER